MTTKDQEFRSQEAQGSRRKKIASQSSRAKSQGFRFQKQNLIISQSEIRNDLPFSAFSPFSLFSFFPHAPCSLPYALYTVLLSSIRDFGITTE